MNDACIYLDHAATTPVDPRVLDAMLPFFSERYGNPSSVYDLGRDARAGLDWARETLAHLLNCQSSEIIMTSGATEANNAAIKGVAWGRRLQGEQPGGHIVISAIEHPSVLQAAGSLDLHGFEMTHVLPDKDGIVAPDAVAAALRPDTCLISVMLASNEIGTIQPLQDIARVARERGIAMHTDAVQAAGALPLDVDLLGVDLLTLSAHKFYGPKGVGALYARQGVPLAWQQHGGGQENTRRGGTENVALIVGMATALALAYHELEERVAHTRTLRDRLIDELLERVPDARLNGHAERRLPNNVNLTFGGVDGEPLLLSLDMLGIAASSGSACSTGSMEPSHVLRAIGLDDGMARGSLRLTVGKDNTRDEIDRAIESIASVIARIRALTAAGYA
ncbi:MAG TPA: cysteine desulfurase family protein [Thermomicrobiales bacterium]|nr:cysteine desulfurase family protein [Thermomicrobiales bacterium]